MSNIVSVSDGKIALYSTPNSNVYVEVVFKDETFWMTQKSIAELFDVNTPAISKHLKNIFDDEELTPDSTVSNYDYANNMTIRRLFMNPVIKPSSELRKNYNSVADICRTRKVPVFLTRNGEGDMVIMDIETYSRREEDLALAQRLASAELARISGIKDLSLDDFEQNMLEAIERGAKQNK